MVQKIGDYVEQAQVFLTPAFTRLRAKIEIVGIAGLGLLLFGIVMLIRMVILLSIHSHHADSALTINLPLWTISAGIGVAFGGLMFKHFDTTRRMKYVLSAISGFVMFLPVSGVLAVILVILSFVGYDPSNPAH